jgi:VWFA-related protein
MSVRVRDSRGRLVTTLGRDDFHLSVDGRPIEIQAFANERHQVTLGILLHTGYPESNPAQVREVARALVTALEPEEQAFIGTFDIEVALSRATTSDQGVLQRQLEEEVWPGVGPHNAIGRAVAEALSMLSTSGNKRALVVVGSDWPEYCGGSMCLGPRATPETAIADDILVYGVVARNGPPPLQFTAYPVERLADRTGGGYLQLTGNEDVSRTMREVLEELRHEYLLGFTPAASDGKNHIISVRLSRDGLHARVRLSNSRGQK